MGQFLQQLINGIQIGSIYALIALGYTMVYGIVRLINFAHADIFMVGAYMGFFLAPVMTRVFGGAFIPTIVGAMIVTALWASLWRNWPTGRSGVQGQAQAA